MAFRSKNIVRMHDTDCAGIMYFAQQFRFAHEALEDFCHQNGFPIRDILEKESFSFVIVHVEADYKSPLRIGDAIEVILRLESIGTSSFTVHYDIIKEDGTLAGTAKTVHVTIDKKSCKKIPLPLKIKTALESKHCCEQDNS